MSDPAEKLSPKARAVYAALATPGTEAQVADRTGISPKTVGARIGQDLVKAGLVEVVGRVANERGRKVRVYGRVPPERVGDVRAVAQDRSRVKHPRQRPLEIRKRMVRELLKDQDLLEELASEKAADQASRRARQAARGELRRREREAAELRRHETRAADEQDPRLPFWQALREVSRGADGARILEMMLDRDVQLAYVRGDPLVGPMHWGDATRFIADALEVDGRLHKRMQDVFDLPSRECPACGAETTVDDEEDVIEAEALDELAELVSGDD